MAEHSRLFPHETLILIIYFCADFKGLKEDGKKYPWPRPANCPNCNGLRLWRHGYVLRYFDKSFLWMLKYRCPDCRSVHTLRPKSHYRRFWPPWSEILASLQEKILNNRWLKKFSRQRQQYWWHGFTKQLTRHSNTGNRLHFLKEQFDCPRLILSTHSLEYFEIKPFRDTPHLTFAVTPGSGFG